jgi:hypothetical protein
MEVEDIGGVDMMKKIKKILLIILVVSVLLPSFIYVLDKVLLLVGRKTKYTMLSGVYYNLIYVFTPCSNKVKKFSDKYVKFEYTPARGRKFYTSYNSEKSIIDHSLGTIRISIIKKEYVINEIQELFSRKIISEDGNYCIAGDCGKIPLDILKKLKNKEFDYETLRCFLTIPAGEGLIDFDMPWFPNPEYFMDEITLKKGLKLIRLVNKNVDNLIYLYGITKRGNIISIELKNSDYEDYVFFYNFFKQIYIIYLKDYLVGTATSLAPYWTPLPPPTFSSIIKEKQSTCAFKRIIDTIEISDEI